MNKSVNRRAEQQASNVVAAFSCPFVDKERFFLCVCVCVRGHVSPYQFVYSVPSWGPQEGCSHTKFLASYLTARVYCGPVFLLDSCHLQENE